MAKSQPRPATDADIEALPPHVTEEIASGMQQTHPRPAPRQGRALARLQGELGGPFDFGRRGPGGWVFIIAPEMHPGANVVVPDTAGWLRENPPMLPDTAYLDTQSDWVCEVLSAKRMEVFELTGEKGLLAETFEDADSVAAPPFAVHSFALDVLWPYDAA